MGSSKRSRLHFVGRVEDDHCTNYHNSKLGNGKMASEDRDSRLIVIRQLQRHCLIFGIFPYSIYYHDVRLASRMHDSSSLHLPLWGLRILQSTRVPIGHSLLSLSIDFSYYDFAKQVVQFRTSHGPSKTRDGWLA